MKAITRQPVWQFPCPHCLSKVRIEGSQYVICCGVVYCLELAVRAEDDTAWATKVYEQMQAIAAMNLPTPAEPMEDPR